MSQTRTALGTNSNKASGTSLSINNVSVPAGATLVVGVAYDGGAGEPEIKYGKRKLKRNVKQIHTTGDFEVALFFASDIRRENTRDIVATWASAIEARAMFASYITEAGAEDVQSKAERTNDTIATTGTNKATTVANTIHISAMASRGPDTDPIGTVNAGDTLGQTIGTSGGVAASNVFLRETYEIQTALGNLRGRLSALTARDNVGCGVAYKAKQTFTITDVTQYHRDMNETPDWVVITVSDGTDDLFRIRIDPVDFDVMTDADVTERVTEYCSAYAQRVIDSDSIVDIDSTRDTRMATFVNDQVII